MGISTIDFLNSMGDGSLCTYAREAGVMGDINKYDKLDEMRLYLVNRFEKAPDLPATNPAIKVSQGLKSYARLQNEECVKTINELVKNNSTYENFGIKFDSMNTIKGIIESGMEKGVMDYVLAHEIVSNEHRLNNPQMIDGRYSESVKKWALNKISEYEKEKGKPFPFDNYNYASLADKNHPVLVDSLIKKYIVLEKELEKAHKGKQPLERD